MPARQAARLWLVFVVFFTALVFAARALGALRAAFGLGDVPASAVDGCSRSWMTCWRILIKCLRWASELALHLSDSDRRCASLNFIPVIDVV